MINAGASQLPRQRRSDPRRPQLDSRRRARELLQRDFDRWDDHEDDPLMSFVGSRRQRWR
jgi:hypothetical protein